MKTKRKLLITLVLVGFSVSYNQLIGQQDRTKILEKTNSELLDSLSVQLKQESEIRKEEARLYAVQNNLPLTMRSKDFYAELMYIDDANCPIYYCTYNTDAALTTNTNNLNSGGSSGYNLDGNNMVIGEWDGGAVLLTHEQLVGRVTQIDGAPQLSNHSTHVAGTLIGDGTGSSSMASDAKGMAPSASIEAYDFNNDDSEMTTFASGGALISNHSYGSITGWRYSAADNIWQWWGLTANLSATGEDPKFGLYEGTAQAWDIIANNAPYYLICKSAGNDRGDGPPGGGESFVDLLSGNTYAYNASVQPAEDGPYDCIPTYGNAKNILTIGAVNDVLNYTGPGSVSISSFSGWGPTDDGRIKPDLVANGISLLSASSSGNSSYYNNSGTSMSAPNATGSLVLLQEHYENLNGSGSFLKSASLKALAIHSAREAGPADGPDYVYGWGLLDAQSAADLISYDVQENNTIVESTLVNNNSYTETYQIDASKPFVATIVWNDPAGATTNSSVVDDPTIKLVNDLDIRATINGVTHMPYVLDPANPASNPTNGDNIRDNVEKIYISNPANSIVQITVSHKGSLNGGAQDFSLIISELDSSLPNLYCNSSGTLSIAPHQITLNNISIGNNGGSTAGASSLGYYLSTNNIISTLDNLISFDGVSALAINQTSTENEAILATSVSVPDGSYYLGYLIDRTFQVTESDETDNNDCVFSLQVTVGCTNSMAHNYDSSANFNNNNCETCNDGVQNGDETGIDCGGSLCGPCCLTNLTITNAGPGISETSQLITTSGTVTIPFSQNTTFRSSAVILKPGMHAQNGSVFRAHVDPCSN